MFCTTAHGNVQNLYIIIIIFYMDLNVVYLIINRGVHGKYNGTIFCKRMNNVELFPRHVFLNNNNCARRKMYILLCFLNNNDYGFTTHGCSRA